jgi:hypothetical protein
MAFYNPGYYPNYMNYQPQQNMPQQNSGMIWVQGEAGMKSYMVAPGNTVPLWDSESKTIYIKSADASGIPSVKVLEYTVKGSESAAPAVLSGQQYITREEFDALMKEVNSIKAELKEGADE